MKLPPTWWVDEQKKATRRWLFLWLERITSFRQRGQQVQQPVQRQHRQQGREQMRQQQVQALRRERVREQERGLLFCHKRPKQRPSVRPRGVIFSC
ncbi:MAG: hypothetical protein RL739_1546 [Pseudomonadota bacterium]